MVDVDGTLEPAATELVVTPPVVTTPAVPLPAELGIVEAETAELALGEPGCGARVVPDAAPASQPAATTATAGNTNATRARTKNVLSKARRSAKDRPAMTHPSGCITSSS